MAVTLFRRRALELLVDEAAARDALRCATTAEELDAALGTAPAPPAAAPATDTARIAHLIASGQRQLARRDALLAQVEAATL